MNEINTLGTRIAKARMDKGMTQAELADKLCITALSVSLWEEGKEAPDLSELIEVSKVLDVSLSYFLETVFDENFPRRKNYFESGNMAAYVRETATVKGMNNTLKALDFAFKAHDGQKRRNSYIPYINHPLHMACHCLAMNIDDDAIIAACLLHDTIEDCGCTYDELPVDGETKELVRLMTRENKDKDNEKAVLSYFNGLGSNPKAALIKCVDRCNNMTTMSWGLSKEETRKIIEETDKYVIPLFTVIRNVPEYCNAAWLLQYQIESTLDFYRYVK